MIHSATGFLKRMLALRQCANEIPNASRESIDKVLAWTDEHPDAQLSNMWNSLAMARCEFDFNERQKALKELGLTNRLVYRSGCKTSKAKRGMQTEFAMRHLEHVLFRLRDEVGRLILREINRQERNTK